MGSDVHCCEHYGTVKVTAEKTGWLVTPHGKPIKIDEEFTTTCGVCGNKIVITINNYQVMVKLK